MSVGSRVLDAIGDRRNIAGLIGAAGGLGLTFGHVIDAGWWAITAGLYGLGFVGTQLIAPPRPGPASAPEPMRVLIDRLSAQMGKLRADLPAGAAAHGDAIIASAREVADRLDARAGTAIDDAPLRQAIGSYVPTSLSSWAAVPRTLRATPTRSGATPNDQLVEQLALIDGQMRDLIRNVAQGDLDAVEAQGRFLRQRFEDGAGPLTAAG